jgi:hypothetical protein
MSWIIWAAIIIAVIIGAEALLIIPDKMPWNRRKNK